MKWKKYFSKNYSKHWNYFLDIAASERTRYFVKYPNFRLKPVFLNFSRLRIAVLFSCYPMQCSCKTTTSASEKFGIIPSMWKRNSFSYFIQRLFWSSILRGSDDIIHFVIIKVQSKNLKYFIVVKKSFYFLFGQVWVCYVQNRGRYSFGARNPGATQLLLTRRVACKQTHFNSSSHVLNSKMQQ